MITIEKYDEYKPHTNFSFKNITNIELKGKDLSRSLLNGTIIENSSFENVSFENADIEGSRFIKSQMNNCNFNSSDMRSLWIVNVNFVGASFDDTNIIDCTFIGCTFVDCSFKRVTLSNCEFNKCSLNPFNLEDSSAMLNTFILSEFKNTIFKNVFYYEIFEDCTYINTTMEAYLLGYVFGLKPRDLEQFNYLYMGEKTVYSIDIMCKNIMEIYMNRGMLINAGMLHLINPDFSKDNALISCISFLEEYIKRDYLVKSEQIQFLSTIIQKLNENEQIAPVTIILLHQKLSEIMVKYRGTSLEKAAKDITTLKNSIYFMYLKYIDRLLPSLHTFETNKKVTLEITYEEKPQIELVKILKQIAPDEEPPKVIKIRNGSFIESISSTENIIKCLEIFISLLSVWVPVTIEKEKRKKEAIEEAEKIHTTSFPQEESHKKTDITINNYYLNSDVSSSTQPVLPKQIQRLSQNDSQNISNTIKVIINNNFISDNHYKGYNCNNIKKIHVIRHSHG